MARALPRSASTPALQHVPPSSMKHAAQDAACKLQSILLVAPSASLSGSLAWEPFYFKHQLDGTVSFGKVVGGGGADTEAVYVESESVLDADWQQPFVAAPWKPFTLRGGHKAQLGMQEFQGRWLYPFTLSYTPQKASREQSLGNALVQHRCILTLAAADQRTREKWLASLSQQARSPALRTSATSTDGCEIVLDPSTLQSMLEVDKLGKAGQRRRLLPVSLGNEHCGLLGPVTLPAPRGSGCGRDAQGRARPKLTTGCGKVWEAHTPLKVVRDLYDCYAADPINGIPGPRDASSASGAWSQKREHFLERYMERQTEIEGMLHKCMWSDHGGLSAAPVPEAASRTLPVGAPRDDPSERRAVAAVDSDKVCHGSAGVVDEYRQEGRASPRLRVGTRTPNAELLSNGDLTVRDWSGGVVLEPPANKSFRLTVRIVDSLDKHPVFLGVAPADVDLTSANCFRGPRSGIFLSLGGVASQDFMCALQTSGAPALYECGAKRMPDMPSLQVGSRLSMDYWEEDSAVLAEVGRSGRESPIGRVCFTLWGADNTKLCQLRPQACLREHRLGFRPCVLLCTPDSRISIEELL